MVEPWMKTVVNPFLHEREVPSSKGPYLSVFRRNVSLHKDTEKGVRDKAGYTAMLEFITILENSDLSSARELLASLLYGLIELRDVSHYYPVPYPEVEHGTIRSVN